MRSRLFSIAVCSIACAVVPSAFGQTPGAASAMQSRTCGLVLLSQGRALARDNDMERSMPSLIGAFALLQDGRQVEDKNAARAQSQKLMRGTPQEKASAVAACAQWLATRKTQPGFANSEADKWQWVAQAQATIQTEPRKQ